MDAKEFDLSNWYDPANGRFTPQLAGYYCLSAGIHINTNLGNGPRLILAMLKNGGVHKNLLITYPVGGDNNLLSGRGIFQANGTTDFFQPALNQNTAASVSIGVGSSLTYFQGELIAPTA
jgi:hypothetical protein